MEIEIDMEIEMASFHSLGKFFTYQGPHHTHGT